MCLVIPSASLGHSDPVWVGLTVKIFNRPWRKNSAKKPAGAGDGPLGGDLYSVEILLPLFVSLSSVNPGAEIGKILANFKF